MIIFSFLEMEVRFSSLVQVIPLVYFLMLVYSKRKLIAMLSVNGKEDGKEMELL